MRDSTYGVLGALVCATALVCVPSVAEPPAERDEPVPLYTNADLERFAPAPAPSVPVAATDREGDWRFVVEFLEREQARLDAERARELELKRLEAEAAARRVESQRPRYVLPAFYPYCGILPPTICPRPCPRQPPGTVRPMLPARGV